MNEVSRNDIIRAIRKLEGDGSDQKMSPRLSRLRELLESDDKSSSQLPIDARINWFKM